MLVTKLIRPTPIYTQLIILLILERWACCQDFITNWCEYHRLSLNKVGRASTDKISWRAQLVCLLIIVAYLMDDTWHLFHHKRSSTHLPKLMEILFWYDFWWIQNIQSNSVTVIRCKKNSLYEYSLHSDEVCKHK